ncbi:MAG: hypothetical protein HY066_09545 [Betaproteobacteria bacterium]|nr:hypothetical protein [Betaproteobacteria bacterium]
MSANQDILRRIAKLGTFLMMGVSMSADAGLFGLGGTSWKEEVLLHDGSKIVVERSVERGGRHEIGQKPPYREQSFTFTLPATGQRVTWEDKYSEDIGTASFLPMLIDIFKDTTYLVASSMGCLSYNKWGRPNPPYVIFKHDGKEWKRIPLQELPAEVKTPNLIFSAPDIEVEKIGKSFITAEMIKQLIDGYKQPEYRSILREPIKGGEGLTSCPIPTTAAAKLIAPEIEGKLLYYNWWPLAQDWLNKTYRGNK